MESTHGNEAACKLDDLLGSYSSDESENEEEDLMCKDFLVLCDTEAANLCAHTSKLKHRQLKELLQIKVHRYLCH